MADITNRVHINTSLSFIFILVKLIENIVNIVSVAILAIRQCFRHFS